MREEIEIYWMNRNYSYLSQCKNDCTIARNFFQKGSFLIPYTTNYQKNMEITKIIAQHGLKSNINYHELMEPIDDFQGLLLKEPRVAHYDKNIVMPFAHNLLVELGFQNHQFITDEHIMNGELTSNNFDIFFIGGQMGSDSEVLKSLLSPEWTNCSEKIREYISNGGNYIGICHGSGRAATKVEKPFLLPLDLKYTQFFNFLGFYLKIIDRSIYRALPGGGFVDVTLTNMNHPISYGLPTVIKNHSYGAGPMFLEMPETKSKSLGKIKEINPDSWNYSYWMDDSYWYTSKLFSEQSKEEKIMQWLNYSKGKTVWVENLYGSGKAIVFGGHPELNWNFAQHTWYNHSTTSFPVRILGNTVLYLSSSSVDNISFHQFVDFSQISGSINAPAWTIENDIINLSAIVKDFNISYASSWFTDFQKIEADNLMNCSFSIKESGNFSIGFCIVDIKGFAWIDTRKITVHEKLHCQLEKQIFEGYSNESFVFSVNISKGIPPYNYEWNFGDGEISNQKTPKHQYQKPGCYKGYICVIDSFQNSNKADFCVNINDRFPEFRCNLSIFPNLLPASVEKEASILVNCSKSGNYTYTFLFDDNENITISKDNSSYCKIHYIFNDTKNKLIKLRVENEMGDTFCLIKKLEYNHIPFIDHFIPIEISTVGKSNEFRIFGVDFDGDDFFINVDYGNGYVDTNNETIDSYVRFSHDFGFYIVSYRWDKPGEYQIRAQIIDEYGFRSEWNDLFTVTIQKPTLIDILIDLLEFLGMVSID